MRRQRVILFQQIIFLLRKKDGITTQVTSFLTTIIMAIISTHQQHVRLAQIIMGLSKLVPPALFWSTPIQITLSACEIGEFIHQLSMSFTITPPQLMSPGRDVYKRQAMRRAGFRAAFSGARAAPPKARP